MPRLSKHNNSFQRIDTLTENDAYYIHNNHKHIHQNITLFCELRHFLVKSLLMSDMVTMTHLGPVTHVWGPWGQGGAWGDMGLGLGT